MLCKHSDLPHPNPDERGPVTANFTPLSPKNVMISYSTIRTFANRILRGPLRFYLLASQADYH